MTLNSIVANFQTFKLVDLLDILIIAFLIYQLLGFVNRTRAGQLAKGALIVMAVYLVANILNMRTVTWLLNSLLQVGLLTLVVLFQPEIRRALERMGQTDQWAYRFFNKNRYNDTSLKGAWRSAIIAICDAAERFSETKTGALIVLERNTNLSEIVRTGTPVNSAVNLEVLGTIFYEGTPLHDGAASSRMAASRRQAVCCPFPTTWTWAKTWVPATAPASASPRTPTPSPSWSARRRASSRWRKTVCSCATLTVRPFTPGWWMR